ncbi:porin family protein [Tenacibaculum sp. TC6]|uniref:porin family protein n=1 Tax=Tenacibaculum sp. TC6 TaxID=3423223 RepID=UPI003D35E0A3
MKKIVVFLTFMLVNSLYAQKDSLQIGDRYFEDQLYLDVSYNVLRNQPEGVKSSSFSYGISAGYIRDIPLTKNGKLALGIGIGYGYDSFSHGLKVIKANSTYTYQATDNTSNTLQIHAVEFPIQFRIRASEVNKYSFWRLYTGVKLSYNIANKFSYLDDNNATVSNTNNSNYNKFQAGLTMSAGYGTFNFYIYYGLMPLLNNAEINSMSIDSKVFKLGLSFYLL